MTELDREKEVDNGGFHPDTPSMNNSANSIIGSESPRSIRDYHKGSGNLTGGGVQKIYKDRPSIKKYKSKLDARLGMCLFFCFLIIGSILCIYGVMHQSVHSELSTYVNRTHQIAQELKLAMDENYPKENSSGVDSTGRQWMTVEELEDDAYLIRETNSSIWCLFWWNMAFCLLLTPVLVLIHCNVIEGNLAKLVYRAIMVVCLIFCIGQLLYLIHPILWGAAKFPGMLDRLFVNGYPRDEYQIHDIQEKFACLFNPHETLVQFDLQTPCLPKMKNSLFPTYSVIFLIFIDLFPFLFVFMTYAWDAWLKNSRTIHTARQRVELNNSRRVPFPKSNVYVPPSERNANKTTSMDNLPGNLV